MRRDEQIVEAELMEISVIQDDMLKLERIVAWCATYPDEVPFALSFLRNQRRKSDFSSETPEQDRSAR